MKNKLKHTHDNACEYFGCPLKTIETNRAKDEERDLQNTPKITRMPKLVKDTLTEIAQEQSRPEMKNHGCPHLHALACEGCRNMVKLGEINTAHNHDIDKCQRCGLIHQEGKKYGFEIMKTAKPIMVPGPKEVVYRWIPTVLIVLTIGIICLVIGQYENTHPQVIHDPVDKPYVVYRPDPSDQSKIENLRTRLAWAVSKYDKKRAREISEEK